MLPAPKPEPALDLPDFRAWVAQCPCVACLAEGTKWFGCDPAHVKTRRNAGDKENVVPLCRHHHQLQHQMGIASFQRCYGINLPETARHLWNHWIEVEAPAF